MSAPEVRWCEDSGMVLRRCNDGTWAVLDVVAEADESSVSSAVRLLPDYLEVPVDWVRVAREAAVARATQRRDAFLAVGAACISLAVGVALGRWTR